MTTVHAAERTRPATTQQAVILVALLVFAVVTAGVPLGLMFLFPLTASFVLWEAPSWVRRIVRIVSAVGLTAGILTFLA